MSKYVCSVCGYVHEGDAAPEVCPVCKVGSEKFNEQVGERSWAAEHVVGVAQGAREDIIMDLRANFEGECSEVGMYLAMARVAHREGYRCTGSNSWFASREKGGGSLRDECIHEIDLVMYLMGYPRPKYVVANESFVNQDLPARINKGGWVSFDKTIHKRDIESAIEGFVVLDNGASIRVRSSHILNTIHPARTIELIGEKSGMMIEKDGTLNMLELVDDCYVESKPDLPSGPSAEIQVQHFVDCIVNGIECKVKTSEAVILMEIIDALYKSASTKQPVIF